MDQAINTYTFIDACETKTLAFEKSKQFEKAFQCMITCFGIYTPNGDQGIILYKYFRLAELALNSGRKDLSLAYVDSAIQMLIPEVRDPEFLGFNWNNFNPGVLKNLLIGLKYKFLASYDRTIEGLDMNKLRELEQLVNIIHEGNVYLHNRIYSDFNRLTREAENFPLYERAIQLNNRLSACNTGAGKYQHGNGVESLAKAFKQAGCNNIVMSLWPVNDASTKEIVVGFIQNLKKGLGKADDLAKSKKDYLAMAPEELKHPYYWAGLVLIGDNEPMFGMLDDQLSWRGLLGLTLLVLLGGMVAYYFKLIN